MDLLHGLKMLEKCSVRHSQQTDSDLKMVIKILAEIPKQKTRLHVQIRKNYNLGNLEPPVANKFCDN